MPLSSKNAAVQSPEALSQLKRRIIIFSAKAATCSQVCSQKIDMRLLFSGGNKQRQAVAVVVMMMVST
jgi:hypothetical protein